MTKLSSMLQSFLKFFGRLQPRLDEADDDPPAMIDPFMVVADAADKAGFDMDIALSRANPCAPIFEVEVIDARGHAQLVPGLRLHEAIKISAGFQADSLPRREPRVFIRPEHLVGLANN
jgi:hypothetical protein